jgi:hypothetical protein
VPKVIHDERFSAVVSEWVSVYLRPKIGSVGVILESKVTYNISELSLSLYNTSSAKY